MYIFKENNILIDCTEEIRKGKTSNRYDDDDDDDDDDDGVNA
jgi:hypothetical protein